MIHGRDEEANGMCTYLRGLLKDRKGLTVQNANVPSNLITLKTYE